MVLGSIRLRKGIQDGWVKATSILYPYLRSDKTTFIIARIYDVDLSNPTKFPISSFMSTFLLVLGWFLSITFRAVVTESRFRDMVLRSIRIE